jgi:hypothetical protein
VFSSEYSPGCSLGLSSRMTSMAVLQGASTCVIYRIFSTFVLQCILSKCSESLKKLM